jgi:hypothetical protein
MLKLVSIILLAATSGQAAPAEPLDVGGCYSLPPLCFTKPICVCNNVGQNCHWGCEP